MNFCKCGCGKQVEKEFFKGHWNRGKVRSQQTKDLISISSKGRKVSAATREKHRIQMIGNKYGLGKKHTEKTRKSISTTLKGRKREITPLFLESVTRANRNPEKINRIRLKNTGRKLSPEAIQKRTATRKASGKICSAETREKRSISLKKTYAKRGDLIVIQRMKHSGHKKFLYTNSGNVVIKMRSNWEVSYAKYLDSKNIIWQYEPKQFKLSNGKRYWPDFFLPVLNEWHEVKGYMTSIAKEKMTLFANDYPKEKLLLITEIPSP